MIDDGTYKLVKYSTGENCLFNLETDPTEQHNLYDNCDVSELQSQMETELTLYIMQSMRVAQEDRRVYISSLSQKPEFGREGWQRQYPRKLV